MSAFSAAVIPVSAAFTPSNNLTVTRSSYANDVITYTVKLKKGVTKLTGAIIKATYDPTVLKVVSCQGNSSGVSGVYAYGADASNAKRYSMAYMNATGFTIGADTKFFTIKFQNISTTRPKTTVKFSCAEFITEDGADNDLKAPAAEQTLLTHSFHTLNRPTLTVDSVVSGGKPALKLQWTKSEGSAGYDVYKKKTGDLEWTLLKADLTGLSYTDYSITKGVEYYYTVAAKNSFGSTHASGLTGVAAMNFGSIEKLAAVPVSAGVRVSWGALNGAEKYDVLRKLKTESTWQVIAKGVTNTYYGDTSVASGVYYNYSIKAYKGKYTAGTSAAIPTVCYIAPPKAVAANTVSGIKLTVAAVGGATKYVISRQTVGGSAKTLATVASTSFKSGKYSYVDKTASANGKYIYSVYAVMGSLKSATTNVAAITRLATPKITEIKNVKTGISVTWKAVSGASKYYVYRKLGGTSEFAYYKTVTKTTYTDTGAANGKTYVYTIVAANSTGCGAYNTTGSAMKRINTPANIKALSHAKGVQVTWSKVSGAQKYSVYRKAATGTASYKLIGTTTSTSYVDTSAAKNVQYRYTVRANISSYSSYMGTSAVGMRFGTIVTLKAAYLENGVKIAWTKLSNAKGYRIYRKTASDSAYTKIATVTSGNTFKDTSLPSGTVCYYKVEAYNGSCIAPMTAATLKVKFLAKPTITVTSTGLKEVTIKFSAVYGADKYVLQRATIKDGKVQTYKTIASIAKGKTSYKDTTVTSGVKYKYRIKAVSGSFSSAYAGATINKVAPPKITSCYNEIAGVQLKWKAVSGAKSYYVYRKTPSSTKWTKIKTVSGTECIDASVGNNKVYQYTVEAKLSSGVTGYNSTKECRFIETPDLTGLENTSSGIKVKWNKVSGATYYRIYRRGAGSSNWTYLGQVPASKAAYTDKNVKKGEYYRYSVRASYVGKDSKGKAYTIYSGLDTNGLYTKRS